MKKIIISFLVVLCFISMPMLLNADYEDVEVTSPPRDQEIRRAGTYFFDMEATDSKGKNKMVRVHVRFPKTNLNYTKQEGIDAHDIIVKPDQYLALKKEQKISEADAHAWSMQDGSNIEVVKVENLEADRDDGAKGKVLFSTEKETDVTVSIFEQDEIFLPLDEVYMNQPPVLSDTIRTITFFTVLLAILPIIFYIIALTFIRKESISVEKLLYKRYK